MMEESKIVPKCAKLQFHAKIDKFDLILTLSEIIWGQSGGGGQVNIFGVKMPHAALWCRHWFWHTLWDYRKGVKFSTTCLKSGMLWMVFFENMSKPVCLWNLNSSCDFLSLDTRIDILPMKFRFDPTEGCLCEYFGGSPDRCLNYMPWATKMDAATKEGMKNINGTPCSPVIRSIQRFVSHLWHFLKMARIWHFAYLFISPIAFTITFKQIIFFFQKIV